jgi:ABC-type multidrug transport system permease subunit
MWKRSFVLELQVLFLRTGRNLVRNKSLLVLHVVISMILALISGIIFTGLQLNLAGFQNRMGAMYFILTFFGFGSLSSMELFIAERALFVKESGARYYSALSYFLAKSMLDLATLRLLPAFLFAVIFYYIMGLNAPVDRFLLFTTTLMLYNVAAGSLSIFLSIVSKNVGIANLLATVVLLVMILFGGFLLNVQTMPAYVAWLQWFSIFKYAFEIMMTNELSGLLLTFDAPGYPSVPVYGEVFLQTLGFDLSNQMRDVVCLIVIAIVLHVISFALLASQVPRTPKLHLKDKND